jgi:hypothetical protein
MISLYQLLKVAVVAVAVMNTSSSHALEFPGYDAVRSLLSPTKHFNQGTDSARKPFHIRTSNRFITQKLKAESVFGHEHTIRQPEVNQIRAQGVTASSHHAYVIGKHAHAQQQQQHPQRPIRRMQTWRERAASSILHATGKHHHAFHRQPIHQKPY